MKCLMNPVRRHPAGWLLLVGMLLSGAMAVPVHAANRQPPDMQTSSPSLSQDVLENGGNIQGILAGTVSIGPICSYAAPGKVCTPRPGILRNVMVRVSPSGSKQIITAKPDEEGRYRLALPAGSYDVAVYKSERMKAPGDLRTVIIRPGQVVHLQSELDAGLR